MSNAATWNDELSARMAAERAPAHPRVLLTWAIILGLTSGLSAWVYFYSKASLHQRAVQVEMRWGVGGSEASSGLLGQLDQLALRIGVIGLAGGVACLIAFSISIKRLRNQIASQAHKFEEQQGALLGLRNVLSETRQTKEELLQEQSRLEEKLKQLSAEKSTLEEELNRRNQAEKALKQKRFELESSKSVLELHVQARTEALQSLQRRYEMILNSAGEGICGLDAEGKATFVNPTVAKLTGWPVDELVGKLEQEIFVSNGESAETLSADERVLYRKDGTRFPVEFVKTPINENGRVVGSVVVFKDITERKQVQDSLARKAAELARSNAELEQFAFVASHDLQEPLRKIQAFGDRLKVRCQSIESSDIQDYLERMQSAAARMRTLINDLLAFSRVIRSSEPFVPVDLAQITKEVLGDLEVRIEKSGAKVELENLPTIEADPMQMRQLILNLLGNALKFQPPGASPLIRISATTLTPLSREPQCEIHVEDNGIGFDEKYMDKIFAVFQRLHGRTEYEGTGVGLAVCRRIVDRHHGTITAKSQPGKGATFIVTLPLKQAAIEEAA
ncbi:MAG TPA: ATP-binding protein [Verrucomicrobiae bacterium]|nr:ATP-binding protein [Verrucomicrobiae bacterium]